MCPKKTLFNWIYNYFVNAESPFENNISKGKKKMKMSHRNCKLNGLILLGKKEELLDFCGKKFIWLILMVTIYLASDNEN